jgi:hypothetical protein
LHVQAIVKEDGITVKKDAGISCVFMKTKEEVVRKAEPAHVEVEQTRMGAEREAAEAAAAARPQAEAEQLQQRQGHAAEAVAILHSAGNDGLATACESIFELADSGRQDELGAAGAVPAVVATLNAHCGSEEVQESGCAALWRLVQGHAGNQTAGEAVGAAQAVVDALKAHRGSELVQRNGCEALAKLSKDHRGNQVAGEAARAVAAVVAALAAHLWTSPGVQRNGCDALRHLWEGPAGHMGNAAAGEAAGVAAAVVAAMRAHGESAGVQQSGCGALWQVAKDHPSNRAAAVAAGGVEAVAAAMRSALHGGLGRKALQVLDPGHILLVKGADVAEAVTILQRSADDAKLASAACERIEDLARNSGQQDELGAAGAVPAVVAALNAHRGLEDVQKRGYAAMCSLEQGNPGNVAAGEAAGAAAAITAAKEFLAKKTKEEVVRKSELARVEVEKRRLEAEAAEAVAARVRLHEAEVKQLHHTHETDSAKKKAKKVAHDVAARATDRPEQPNFEAAGTVQTLEKYEAAGAAEDANLSDAIEPSLHPAGAKRAVDAKNGSAHTGEVDLAVGGAASSKPEPAALEVELARRGLVRQDNPNSSRHMGVSWHEPSKKWKAQVYHGGKKEHLGHFATEEEAKARYDARRLELGKDPHTGITSGFRGVTWQKAKRKWESGISVGGKKKHLGYFEATAGGVVDATLAYDAAARAAGRPDIANFEAATAEQEPCAEEHGYDEITAAAAMATSGGGAKRTRSPTDHVQPADQQKQAMGNSDGKASEAAEGNAEELTMERAEEVLLGSARAAELGVRPGQLGDTAPRGQLFLERPVRRHPQSTHLFTFRP